MQKEAQVPGTRSGLHWGIALVIGLVTFAVFARSLGGEFINDDLMLIARNPDLHNLAGLTNLLTRPMWSGLPEFAGAAQVGHWRPLTSLVLALGFGLGGGVESPWVFHLLSLALHLVATFAAFRLARRLLGGELAAAAAALLFALHPLHVESVAWISAINDPLFGALSLFAIDAWLGWRARSSRGLPWLAAALFFAALLTKEFALAILPILLVFDLVPLRQRRSSDSLRPWVLLAAVLGLWFGLRMLVFGELAGGLGRANAEYGGAIWRARLELFGGGMWHLFVPTHLSPLEPFREAWPPGSIEARLKTIGLLLFIAMIAAGSWSSLRSKAKRPALLLTAALGILAAVSPALAGIRGLGQTPFADRYWYLAVFFFAVFIIAAAQQLFARRGMAALLAPVLLLGSWYAVRDVQAQASWRSPKAFYETVIERHPDAPAAYWNLAEIERAAFIDSIGSSGLPKFELLERALGLYRHSAELLAQAAIDPTIPKDEIDYLRTGVGQAWCYLLQAEFDAYKDYDTPRRILEMLLEQVMKREAGNQARGGQRARLPVEEVLTTLGIVKLRSGDEAGAADDFRRALDMNPRYVPALHNLGAARFHAQQYGLSSKLFSAALALSPGDPELLELYAQSLFEEGWGERALEVASQLENVAPDNPTPEILRGLEALKRRDLEVALDHFDRALGRAPRSSVALFQRGMVLRAMGELDKAIAALRKACEADTEDFTAHYNLASMLFERGAPDTARPYLERAYAVGTGRSELPLVRQQLLQLDPENAVRMRTFAELDDARDDTAGALFWTERALAFDPENGRSRHLKGRILLDAKEPLLALPELLHATELLPSGYLPFFDLGRCQTELGRYDAAREAYGRARELVAAQEGPVGPNITDEARAGFELLKTQLFGKIDSKLSSLPKGR